MTRKHGSIPDCEECYTEHRQCSVPAEPYRQTEKPKENPKSKENNGCEMSDKPGLHITILKIMWRLRTDYC